MVLLSRDGRRALGVAPKRAGGSCASGLGLALADLRRGSTRIAGIAFSRAQHPVRYWSMILITATATAAAGLLAGSVADGHG